MQSVFNGAITLIAFFLMLGLLVLVHELGHFLTARRLGIKVEEFGFGYPPRALTMFERDGVKYTLNWLPIGGFVRFGGEGEQVYGVGSLSMAAPWKKILVLAAGPLMNLLLTFVIFAGLFAANGIPDSVIGEVYPNTPAARAGLQPGDLIVQLDGQPVARGDMQSVSQSARRNNGRTIEVVVERDGARLPLQVTPGPWEAEGVGSFPVGFGISYAQQRLPVGPIRAVALGFQQTFTLLVSFVDGLGQLIGGLFGFNEPPPGGVAGVVGIARGTGEVIQRDGWVGFWQWTAAISLNLFLVNLLPIPALDGSHIVFSLIEVARRGKKIPPEKEALVHAVGFVMVLGLMLVITVSDVANWISGAPVLPGG